MFSGMDNFHFSPARITPYKLQCINFINNIHLSGVPSCQVSQSSSQEFVRWNSPSRGAYANLNALWFAQFLVRSILIYIWCMIYTAGLHTLVQAVIYKHIVSCTIAFDRTPQIIQCAAGGKQSSVRCCNNAATSFLVCMCLSSSLLQATLDGQHQVSSFGRLSQQQPFAPHSCGCAA